MYPLNIRCVFVLLVFCGCGHTVDLYQFFTSKYLHEASYSNFKIIVGNYLADEILKLVEVNLVKSQAFYRENNFGHFLVIKTF